MTSTTNRSVDGSVGVGTPHHNSGQQQQQQQQQQELRRAVGDEGNQFQLHHHHHLNLIQPGAIQSNGSTASGGGGSWQTNHHNGAFNPSPRKTEYETPRMEHIDEQIRSIDPSSMEVPPDEHTLQHAYTIWFSRRSGMKANTSMLKFEDSLKVLATFRSVERFWKFYIHLKFPNELSGHCDYHVFKYGIKPMWEDPANREGGKWIVHLRKGVASRVWENVILAILGEQFLVGDEICGAVMSVRYNQEDIISVWNRTADDKGVRIKIMETLRRVANLPQNHSLEYKRHNRSLLDKSSFRNADETVFR